ncbi:fungal-specific transcription factor domain-containing protein, partial [Nemania sp. FL0031]
MRTLAASFSSQFQLIRNSLYKQARQLLDTIETDCQDNQAFAYSLSIEQVQAWILLAMYEWMSYAGNYQCGMVSAGRAFRLVQLMRLYDIDDLKNPGSNAQSQDRDWVDVESMRRTFWLAFTIDRFTSAIDGLPLTFDERQIRTRLPAPDACFSSARPITMGFLSATINAIENERQIDSTSPFTQSIIAATVCGRVLEHRHQSPVAHELHLNGRHPPERIRDAMYEFCNRHRSINALLAQHQKLLSVNNLSEHPDPLLIFVALTEYMAVFMLYETIESKFLGTEVQAKQVADALSSEQKQQLGEAVNDLTLLTTTLRQLNHFQTHPLTPIPLLLIAKFCLAHNRLHEESYSTLIPHIHTALQGLTGLNALAQIAVQLLS